ncbi:hypothetical protein T492DRAFT_164581 [Pavlovales sp. CCMP2436]|nr:hypothetical protein T492DRAFT_164581 [Pavlovales sp. CCMP2436]
MSFFVFVLFFVHLFFFADIVIVVAVFAFIMITPHPHPSTQPHTHTLAHTPWLPAVPDTARERTGLRGSPKWGGVILCIIPMLEK